MSRGGGPTAQRARGAEQQQDGAEIPSSTVSANDFFDAAEDFAEIQADRQTETPSSNALYWGGRMQTQKARRTQEPSAAHASRVSLTESNASVCVHTILYIRHTHTSARKHTHRLTSSRLTLVIWQYKHWMKPEEQDFTTQQTVCMCICVV